MKAIRAIAVDDEKHCIETLLFELERHCPEVEMVQSIQDPSIAMEILSKTDVDLVFLDIHLQSVSGIDLLEKLMPVDFDVIFVTAYDEYAIKAFDLSATHYLLKPVNGKKLRSAIDKVHEKREQDGEQGSFPELLEAIKGQLNKANKLALPVQDGVEFIDPNDIICVRGDSNYSTIHFTDGKKTMVSKTLKILEEELLPAEFIRIHKSHIININKLKKYVKTDGGYVIMNDGQKLVVSRYRKQVLNEIFR